MRRNRGVMVRSRGVSAATGLLLLTGCSAAGLLAADPVDAPTTPRATVSRAGALSPAETDAALSEALLRLNSATTARFTFVNALPGGEDRMIVLVDRDKALRDEQSTLGVSRTPSGARRVHRVLTKTHVYLNLDTFWGTHAGKFTKTPVAKMLAERGWYTPPDDRIAPAYLKDAVPKEGTSNPDGSAQFTAEVPLREALSLLGMEQLILRSAGDPSTVTGTLPITVRIDANGRLTTVTAAGKDATAVTGLSPTPLRTLLAVTSTQEFADIDAPVTITVPRDDQVIAS